MTSWPRFAMGELFEIARGGSPRPIDDFITDGSDGINWVSISDASGSSKFITKTKRRIKPSGVSRSRTVKPGDFLLTNSMSFGRPYIMGTTGCIHDGWLLLRPVRPDIDPDYFYRLLGSDVVYNEFSRLASGATVKNLNIELVRSVEVRLPPLPEQRRVAAILDQADALRAKRREAVAKARQLAQAAFMAAFGDPATNPMRWPIAKLSVLVSDGDTINYGVIQPGENCDDGVPLVRVGDLMGGRVQHRNLKRIGEEVEAAYPRSRLRGDEILVSCVGSIGEIALTTLAEKGFNIARAVARIRVNDRVRRVFLSEYLSTAYVQNYFTSELRIVSQPTLNIKQIGETKVFVPPIADQDRFCDQITALSKVREKLEASEIAYGALFASLQHRAFCGGL